MANYFPGPYNFETPSTGLDLYRSHTFGSQKHLNKMNHSSVKKIKKPDQDFISSGSHFDGKIPKNNNSRIVMEMRKKKKQQSAASMEPTSNNKSIYITPNQNIKTIIEQRKRLSELKKGSFNSKNKLKKKERLNNVKNKNFLNKFKQHKSNKKIKVNNQKPVEQGWLTPMIYQLNNDMSLLNEKNLGGFEFSNDLGLDELVNTNQSEITIKLNGSSISHISHSQKKAQIERKNSKKQLKNFDFKDKIKVQKFLLKRKKNNLNFNDKSKFNLKTFRNKK